MARTGFDYWGGTDGNWGRPFKVGETLVGMGILARIVLGRLGLEASSGRAVLRSAVLWCCGWKALTAGGGIVVGLIGRVILFITVRHLFLRQYITRNLLTFRAVFLFLLLFPRDFFPLSAGTPDVTFLRIGNLCIQIRHITIEVILLLILLFLLLFLFIFLHLALGQRHIALRPTSKRHIALRHVRIQILLFPLFILNLLLALKLLP